jgi:phosphatidylglycerol:prolipoprotein diacylglycerol transferase
MQPILATFDLGGTAVTLSAYATFVSLAAAVALALGVRAASGLGVGRVAAIAGLGVAIVAGLVGARLLSVGLDWPAYASDPGRIVEARFRGFALYGGLLAGSAAMLAVAVRGWRISPARLADRAVVAVVAGIVLIRIGCFLNGCCAGIATDLPWGLVFPPRTGALDAAAPGGFGFLSFAEEAAPVHPTQLYEIAAALACGALAWALARRGAAPGVPALAFAAGFLAFRAADQLLRVPPPEGGIPAWTLPAGYVVVAAGVGVLLWRRWRAAPRGMERTAVVAASPVAGPEVDRRPGRPVATS